MSNQPKAMVLAAAWRDALTTRQHVKAGHDMMDELIRQSSSATADLEVLVNAEADLAAVERRLQKEHPSITLKSLAGLRELIARTTEKVSQ